MTELQFAHRSSKLLVALILVALVSLAGFAGTAEADVTPPTVDNTVPSPGSGARTVYTIGFAVSSTGGLSAAAGSRITVGFPAGTNAGSLSGSSVIDVTTANKPVGSCGTTSTTVVTCSLFGGDVINANDTVSVVVNGVVNPSTASGSNTASVSTTSDITPVRSSQYSIGGTPAPTVTGVSPTGGPTGGGNTVTITGTGFISGGTTVAFGANPANNVSVTSATQLTTTAPAGIAGTVDITATTVGGTSATAVPDKYTYLAPPPPRPAVTAVSPGSGPAAGGTSVTLSGSGFTGASAVKFGTATSGATTVVSDSTITATSPAGSGTVDVTVTGPGGTSLTSSADHFTFIATSPGSSTPPAVSGTSSTVQGSTSATVNGTVNPSGQPTTAHFEYGLDPSLQQTPGPLYDQQTPDQTVGADSSSHMIQADITSLVPNARYHYRLVATSSVGTTTGPDQTFTTPPSPKPPPPPVLGRTADVKPISGHVFIKPPPGKTLTHRQLLQPNLSKGTGFLPLTEARSIPSGSTIDARQGTLQLVTATGSTGKLVKTQTGIFNGGLFTSTQSAAGLTKGLTTLTLLADVFPGAPSYAKCKSTKASTGPLSAHIAATGPSILQTLHARDNHGKFRTRGRYSAGTVRGTIWDTTETCAGTLTTVKRGTVDVLDFGKRKTVTVHAGHRYLAKRG